MHFVLEAGFFVEHYPGIQIASIGPRIVEPHSTSERVELKTIEDIWQVLIELLKRLADSGWADNKLGQMAAVICPMTQPLTYSSALDWR